MRRILPVLVAVVFVQASRITSPVVVWAEALMVTACPLVLTLSAMFSAWFEPELFVSVARSAAMTPLAASVTTPRFPLPSERMAPKSEESVVSETSVRPWIAPPDVIAPDATVPAAVMLPEVSTAKPPDPADSELAVSKPRAVTLPSPLTAK